MGSEENVVAKQLEALTEISRAITSDLYLEDLLKLIVLVTAEVMDASNVSLMLLDEKSQELQIRATQSISEEYLSKPPTRLGEGIAGLVASEGKPISSWDVTEDERYINKEVARKDNLRSLLSVPMSVKGRITGVLNCYTSKHRGFSEEEINLLTAVACQAAIAIENTELMVRTRVVQEELETRKLVDRAKDILMRNRGITGEEAYKRIQRKAMDTRKSMRDIAEAIILADLPD